MILKFKKYPSVNREIECYPINKRKYFVLAYRSVVLSIDKNLTNPTFFNIKISKRNAYRKYIENELTECEEYQKIYPIEDDIDSSETLYEKINTYLQELSDIFWGNFPFKTSIKSEQQIRGCAYFKEYFYADICAAFSFLCTTDLDLLPNTDDEIDETDKLVEYQNYLNKSTYSHKIYETECEIIFFNEIKKLLSYDYHISAQVCLESIIDKKNLDGSNTKHRGELKYIIDFGIFKREVDGYHIKLLIEVNDKSHEADNRVSRDKKVQMILDKAEIKLITFKPIDRYNKEFIIEQLGEFTKPELRKI